MVEVGDTEAVIVGFSARTNKKFMRQFQNLMNKHYDVDLKGY